MATLTALTSGRAAAGLAVRDIGADDLKAALRAGFDDFLAMPTHVVFISLMYPLIGLVLATLSFGNDVLPLLFPLASGFALIGPFAAVGLYELSRRRQLGQSTGWNAAFRDLARRDAGALLAIGGLLGAIFLAWIVVADALYAGIYGAAAPGASPGAAPGGILAFAADVLTTPRGWALIVIGNLVGFAFSLLALALSIVSVPLIVDRHVDALTAVATSVAAFRRNPRTLLGWGVLVAAVLVAGTLPLFVGLAVAMPILGHATWHLYRRIVA
ncbi:DUF2189 domain-containing protein [Methylobacterium sp. NEAU 140]|uniref:DUF2189 domain-containing protein n=1 Tax=Methylobacterium sp. NEAU 140 TaxID=3064945 RepID=UPI0027368319|nr:DUF2189 domain-containing protein [Methylobacterium sp. NEAU 140]MDP4022628.1 DUF2189 domain-containing protein [Methylobacterium sp. NEAU 140]